MSSNQDKEINESNGKEFFKQYRKSHTKLTEITADIVRLGLEGDEDGQEVIEKAMNELTGGQNCKLGKGAKAMFKQHKDAQREGEMEFLADYLKSLTGNNSFDKDPYGNGVQSQLKGFEAMKLRTQWATGFDYNPETNERLSDWCKACFYGDEDKVKRYISGIASDDDRMKLLERRESMIRFCGILHAICGARINPSNRHISVAKLLIDAGCKLDVKDVAGYTAVHHCLTQYGNSTTLEIAKILVKNGADVNAVNRFGCTPLFEPCMNFNYEFVEFLVTKGANPSIKDNDGISCQQMVMRNPRMASLFSKGYRAMAKSERAQSSKDGEEKSDNICGYCGGSGKLSKCSGCLSVKYCSRACQSHDWKIHKPTCKELQISRKAEGDLVYVKPVINPYGQEFVMYNEKTKKVDKTSRGKNQNIKPGAEKAMKVKIQVSLGPGGAKHGPMLVYNKDRSYKCYIVEDDANYKAVHKKIVEKGYGGVKAYFAATLKKSGDLQINLAETCAETF
ncbi:hypothetical protein ACHWQZ_G011205 [Mnemiopsis leidyi]